MMDAILNPDVLAIVCEFLTCVSDVLSFSLTCSTLRPIAIRRLLSMHTICLTSGVSIRRFHRFLFADVSAHAPHVRSLEIGSLRLRHSPHFADQPGNESLLIEILKSCPHLEYISLSTKDAVIPLNEGSHQDPIDVPVNTHVLLHVVRAPLRTLRIDIWNPEGTEWHPAALEAFLPRFAPTLEKLELSCVFLDQSGKRNPEGSVPSHSLFAMTQYCAIRSLSVRYLEGLPLLNFLHHLFPSLDGVLCIGEFGRCTVISDHEYLRTDNQLWQKRNADSAWKKLDRLVCRPVTFYKASKEELVVALSENPVSRLKLSLMLSPEYRMLDGIFPVELGGTLSHLTLCMLHVKGSESISDAGGTTVTGLGWDDILMEHPQNKTRSSLEPLQKLTHLRVLVHCNIYDHRVTLPMAQSKFTHALRNSIIDLEDLAASLVRLLPSLQYVFLTTSAWFGRRPNADSEQWYVAHAWRVIQPAGGTAGQIEMGKPVLVGLTDEVAEMVIRNEELVLSDEDKIELCMPTDY